MEAPAELTNISPVLRRAWHAVALAEEVTDDPIQVRLLNEPWVLARLDNELVGFADRCPHRLAPMSAGRVVDGDDGHQQLACGYHGWRYDATGQCVLIPALSKRENISRRAQLARPWSLQEAYGLIWLAPDEPLAPLPDFPEWALSDMDRARSTIVRTSVGAGQLVDNFLDAAHFPFVHADSFGVTDAPELAGGEVLRSGNLVEASFVTQYRDRGEISEHTVTKRVGPGTTVTLRLDLPHAIIGILFACLPETDEQTRVFKLICRNDLNGDAARIAAFIKEEDQILEEDLRILERYESTALPLDMNVEMHTKSDSLSIAWRKLMADVSAAPAKR